MFRVRHVHFIKQDSRRDGMGLDLSPLATFSRTSPVIHP
jgi:hypothetical protein